MYGLIALAVVAFTGWRWFQLIENVAVPRNRTAYLASFVAGGLLGVFALTQGGFVGSLAGGFAAVAGLGFSALRLQSGQKATTPAVTVGEPMLAFSAPDENGVDFESVNLSGKPYLLKFFRGHW